jgi:hypothetical protein
MPREGPPPSVPAGQLIKGMPEGRDVGLGAQGVEEAGPFWALGIWPSTVMPMRRHSAGLGCNSTLGSLFPQSF